MRPMEIIGPVLVILAVLAMAQYHDDSVRKEAKLSCQWDHVYAAACE